MATFFCILQRKRYLYNLSLVAEYIFLSVRYISTSKIMNNLYLKDRGNMLEATFKVNIQPTVLNFKKIPRDKADLKNVISSEKWMKCVHCLSTE